MIKIKYPLNLNGALRVIALITIVISETHAGENIHKGEILEVGSGKQFAFPSIAAEFARDGDEIHIDADGLYDGDTAIWKASNLTIKGINGRPHISNYRKIKNGKGIWVVKGNNIHIENVEFSGAKVNDENGAAIRAEGANLTVKSCYIHHNENGILTGKNRDSEVVLENNEFAYNGYGRGQTHNVYIGRIKKLIFIGNYSHHAIVGHTLKSRANENQVLYNRIMDAADGNSSYLIDLSNGGYSIVMGNLIQQSERAENWAMLSYGAEGLKNKNNELYVLYNTFVNFRSSGVFIKTATGAAGVVMNNIFAGEGKQQIKEGFSMDNNYRNKNFEIFTDAEKFNFKLAKQGAVIDKATDVILRNATSVSGPLIPESEVTDTTGRVPRKRIGASYDLGAFEYQ